MPSIASSILLGASLLGIAGATWSAQQPPASIGRSGEPDAARIIEAFGKQGIRIDSAEARDIRPDVLLALREAQDHGIGNSKVDFAAVEIKGAEIHIGSNILLAHTDVGIADQLMSDVCAKCSSK